MSESLAQISTDLGRWSAKLPISDKPRTIGVVIPDRRLSHLPIRSFGIFQSYRDPATGIAFYVESGGEVLLLFRSDSTPRNSGR